jgi:hypothetical protein
MNPLEFARWTFWFCLGPSLIAIGSGLGCFIVGVYCGLCGVPLILEDDDLLARWCSWWGLLGYRLGRRK